MSQQQQPEPVGSVNTLFGFGQGLKFGFGFAMGAALFVIVATIVLGFVTAVFGFGLIELLTQMGPRNPSPPMIGEGP